MSRFLVFIAAISMWQGVAYAEQDPLRASPDEKGIFTFSLENDLFSGEDDNYTNGIRVAYLAPENSMPQWLLDSAGLMPFFSGRGRKRWHVAVGQSMFTPGDITQPQLQVNDRPYAGWLYGSIGMTSDTGYRLDNLQLEIGVVGPWSAADISQDFVHDTIGSADPQGWDHQLDNEPGFILTYERKWRGLYEFEPFGLAVDVTPSVGASLGNIYTHAAAGAVFRLGYDLPADYGPPLIRPNLPGSDFFIPNKDFSWYLFTGFEGRAVARNIFLDGNTFSSSHSVDKLPFVGGVQAGVAVILFDTRIAYTHLFRSKEFRGQAKIDEFGAITISRRF